MLPNARLYMTLWQRCRLSQGTSSSQPFFRDLAIRKSLLACAFHWYNEGTYTSGSAEAAAAVTRRARQSRLGTSKTFRHTLDSVTGHGNQDDMVVHVGYNNGCSPLLRPI